jgi:acyl-ACP thioesterase
MHNETGEKTLSRTEAESLWVLIDRASSRLARLPAVFDDLYAASTQGRKVSAKLELSPDPAPEAKRVHWPLRVADIDMLGHANNAVYWAAVETALAGGADGTDTDHPLDVVVAATRDLVDDDVASVHLGCVTVNTGPNKEVVSIQRLRH